MTRQFKNREDFFDYLMHSYVRELEEVPTKKGMQKRLKDNELEQRLKEETKKNVQAKDLSVELKLGPNYNRSTNVWIQIFTPENRSGTKGRYVGISFEKDNNEIAIWNGFGRGGHKRNEILELAKEYKLKYSLIEPNLKYGFEYIANCNDAIFIIKKIKISNFKDVEFERDINYITELYKTYEERFENAVISVENEKKEKTISQKSYEELNEKMLTLIEEAGNIAKELKKMRKGEKNS